MARHLLPLLVIALVVLPLCANAHGDDHHGDDHHGDDHHGDDHHGDGHHDDDHHDDDNHTPSPKPKGKPQPTPGPNPKPGPTPGPKPKPGPTPGPKPKPKPPPKLPDAKYNGYVEYAKLMRAGAKAGRYKTLGELIDYSGVNKILPVVLSYYKATLFAPTDFAFSRLPPTPKPLPRQDVATIIGFHLVKGRRKFKSLQKNKKGKKYTTAIKDVRLLKTNPKKRPNVIVGLKGGKPVRVAFPDQYVSDVVVVQGVNAVILPGPKGLASSSGGVTAKGVLASWAAS